MKLIEITDYNSKELDIFARTSEAALANLYAPDGGIFIAESPKVIERALAAGYEPESILAQRGQLSGDGGHILTCARMCRCIPRRWMFLQRLRDLSSQGESCVR